MFLVKFGIGQLIIFLLKKLKKKNIQNHEVYEI